MRVSWSMMRAWPPRYVGSVAATITLLAVLAASFGRSSQENAGLASVWAGAQAWLESYTDILAAQNQRRLVEALRAARAGGHPIVFKIGGHVMKSGVTPYLVD